MDLETYIKQLRDAGISLQCNWRAQVQHGKIAHFNAYKCDGGDYLGTLIIQENDGGIFPHMMLPSNKVSGDAEAMLKLAGVPA